MGAFLLVLGGVVVLVLLASLIGYRRRGSSGRGYDSNFHGYFDGGGHHGHHGGFGHHGHHGGFDGGGHGGGFDGGGGGGCGSGS